MIEAVMYFVLGLLVAGLIALALTPAVWRRAHRLARARVESSLPMSLGEVQAEKDQLRASYAMGARRLEMEVADLKRISSEHVIGSSRYKGEIAGLNAAVAAKDVAIAEIEAKLSAAEEATRKAAARAVTARDDVAARDATLVERSRAVSTLETQLSQINLVVEEQRLELVARDTRIGNLEDQITAAKASENAIAAERDDVRAALNASDAALAAERKRIEGLEARISALGVERADRVAAMDRHETDIAALRTELASARLEREALVATTAALDAERNARAGAAATLSDAGIEPSGNGGDNMRKALESVEAEKTALEARLAALEAEHAAALAERREGTPVSTPPAEATTDDAIRARLAEIAATVLQFTRNPDAGVVHPTPNGNGHVEAQVEAETAEAPTADESGDPPAGDGRSLGERIRSLQQARVN